MSIAAVDNSQYVVPKAAAKKSELNMETFLRLLTVQLSNQNPLEPMKDSEFFAQMAQLGQVQGMDKLTKQSDIQQAQELMGKEVTAVRPMTDTNTGQGELVTGVVTKLSIKQGEYYLGIKEAGGGVVDVKMGSIQSISPKSTLGDYSAMIGKNVSGSVMNNGQSTAIVGKVIGLSDLAGTINVQVRTANGTIVPLPVDRIDNISEG